MYKITHFEFEIIYVITSLETRKITKSPGEYNITFIQSGGPKYLRLKLWLTK